MNLREAAQQALGALESWRKTYLDCGWSNEELRRVTKAINALRAALSEEAMQRLTDVQQEMEPVAVVTSENNPVVMSWWHEPALPVGTKLYTSSQKREWVGLTEEEIAMLDWESFVSKKDAVRAVQAKLKEKNS